jgi:hypothetical protein
LAAAGATRATSPVSASGLFASVFGVLHHARRIQSRRVLRQYRHLMDPGDRRSAFLQTTPENCDHVDQ